MQTEADRIVTALLADRRAEARRERIEAVTLAVLLVADLAGLLLLAWLVFFLWSTSSPR